MAFVRNTSGSARGLCAFAPPVEGAPQTMVVIDEVTIPAGGVLEVEDRFLESDGAKELIGCGVLVIGESAESVAEPQPAPEPAAEPELDWAPKSAPEPAAEPASNGRKRRGE